MLDSINSVKFRPRSPHAIFFSETIFSWHGLVSASVRIAVDVRPTTLSPAIAPHRRVAETRHSPLTAGRVVSQRRGFRSLPRRSEAAGGLGRRVAACDSRSLTLPGLRPGHRQPRPRPARVRPDFYRVRRPHGRDLPDAAGAGAYQD